MLIAITLKKIDFIFNVMAINIYNQGLFFVEKSMVNSFLSTVKPTSLKFRDKPKQERAAKSDEFENV